MNGPEHLAIFVTLERAREWAWQQVKGFPAWRVIVHPDAPAWFVVELRPNGPLALMDPKGDWAPPKVTS